MPVINVSSQEVRIASAGVLRVVRQDVTRTIVVGGTGPQGPIGPAGSGGGGGSGGHQFFDFEFGDAQPITLLTAPAGKLIVACEITISEAFNGVGAALKIGDAGQVDRVMLASDSLPSQLTSFAVAPNLEYVSDTAISLSITPGAGATSGRGTIALLLQP